MDVSIVVPVYNVAPYIIRCLNSLATQTYRGSLECILVDDRGDDDSMVLVTEFVNNYQGKVSFRIVHHPTNMGLSVARNTGIEEAKGEYVYFLDSDDWIDTDCIASMMAMAECYPQVEMVQAGAASSIDHLQQWLDLRNSHLPEYIETKRNIKPLMLDRKKIPVTAWNRLIKRSFIIDNELFFRPGIIHEDELWTFEIAKHLNSLAILKQNVYHYEPRETGITAVYSKKSAESLIEIAKQMIAGVNSPFFSGTIDYIRHFIFVFSFDIQEEPLRLAMLDCSIDLSARCGLFRRMRIFCWVRMAKLNIRQHPFLYSILYHLA